MVLTATNNLPPITLNYQGILMGDIIPRQAILTSTLPDNTTTEAIEIPTYTGDFVAIPLPDRQIGINRIEVNGIILSPIQDNSFDSNNLPSESNPIPANFYWYDYTTGTIYIAPSFNASGLFFIYSYPSPPPVKSTLITSSFPDFFTKFNIVGELTINRAFQSHPSAQLVIIDDYEAKYEELTTYFKKGNIFTIRGINFRADNPQLELREIVRGGIRQITMTCTVAFKGRWEGYQGNIDHPIDQPISIKELVRESGIDYYTVSNVASKAGVPFSGSNRKIFTSVPVESGSSVTLSSLLESRRFYPDGKIIDWEGSTIRLRSWDGMPTLVLPDYMENWGIQTGDRAKLTNAVLSLTETRRDGGRGDIYQTLIEGRSDYQSPPNSLQNGYYTAFNYEQLRTPAWCFDVTSDKTIRTVTEQLNGTDLTKTEEEWGFVYTSLSTYVIDGTYYYFSLSDALLNVDWQQVSFTEKTYHYNSNNGYLEKVTGKTRKLARIKQETGDNEAVILTLAIEAETDEEAIAVLAKQRSAYTDFFWLEVPYLETYELDDLSRYYPELAKSDNDENYIPPLFVKSKTVEEGAIFTFPNPDSTAEEPLPDVVIGEVKRETQRIIITDTRLEKYKTKQETFTQNGFNLEDSVSSFTEEDNEGRPSLQIRLERFGTTRESEENEEDTTTKYLMSTDGSRLNNQIENGTIEYPDITKLSEAIRGIQTEYSILNCQSEEVITLSGREILNVAMGQRVQFKGKTYRLLSLSERIRITNKFDIEDIQISIGKDSSVTVQAIAL